MEPQEVRQLSDMVQRCDELIRQCSELIEDYKRISLLAKQRLAEIQGVVL